MIDSFIELLIRCKWGITVNIKKYNHIFIAILGLFLMIGLIGCSKDTVSGGNTDSAKQKPTEGGTLNVAISADPDTIDWMYTGATVTRDVGWHIFETLFALDKDYKPRPMIAEDYEISDDQKTYTINIRKDVNFHDGSAVTADDVVASIDRWRKVSSVGTIASEYIDQVKATDEHTVEITLNQVYSPLLADMAAPKSALTIIPEKIAKDAGEQPLQPEQLVGTGPFKFETWDRGSEIVLAKFEDYSARDETDWGGLTGKKVAYLDEIKFQIVKDPQVMINGLKTDLYDYVQQVPPDLYQMVESDPKMDPVSYINGYSTITPNKAKAPFDDIKARKALNHALDKKTIAEATYGNDEFYHFDGGLFDPEQKELYTEDGTDGYLAYDKDKAEQLLEESSYDGKPITIMFSNSYPRYEKIAEVLKEQLEEVGFKVELEPYEWATYLEKWQDPKNWDLVVVGWSTRFSPSELGMLILDTNSSGWYNSDRWEKLLNQWSTANSREQKKEILAKMNQTVNEELPFIKVVNESTLDAKSDKLKDYDSWVGQRFWNTWKSK